MEAGAGELANPSDLNVMADTHGVAVRLAQAYGLAVAPRSEAYAQLQELARVALLEGANRAIWRARRDYGASPHDPRFANSGSSECG